MLVLTIEWYIYLYIYIYVINFPAYASSIQRIYFHPFVFFHFAYPVTGGHQTSVQIIKFVVICYNSHITLHPNSVFKERKKKFLLVFHNKMPTKNWSCNFLLQSNYILEIKSSYIHTYIQPHTYHHHHHHHNVPEGLGMLSCSLILKMNFVPPSLPRSMFLLPFGLYCSACFGSLFVSVLCTCCSHFSWYSLPHTYIDKIPKQLESNSVCCWT